VVHLVQVDPVGLEAPQRGLALADDAGGQQLALVGPVAHRPVDLGGDDDLVAAPAALGEPAADDLLGDALALAPAVDVGRVEDVDPMLQRAVHHAMRLVLSR